jgi:hypothetical protein
MNSLYFKFKGEPVRVVIWIPIGFKKIWEEIKKFNVPIDSYYDFIRLSIITYVDRPEFGFDWPKFDALFDSGEFYERRDNL